jgi:hypothetical protein
VQHGRAHGLFLQLEPLRIFCTGHGQALIAPRINHLKTKTIEIPFITGDQGKAILRRCRTEKAINDALAAELKAAVTEFKQSYR